MGGMEGCARECGGRAEYFMDLYTECFEVLDRSRLATNLVAERCQEMLESILRVTPGCF